MVNWTCIHTNSSRTSKKEESENLINFYIINRSGDLKLKTNSTNEEIIQNIIERNKLGDKEENTPLFRNYDFFLSKINKNNIAKLEKGFQKLEFVEIWLNQRDKPQLIYESINSTGINLTQSDLIRNYVLIGLTDKKQEKYYTNYWKKIENNTKQKEYNKTDSFFSDYLTLKYNKRPKNNQIYEEFKTKISVIAELSEHLQKKKFNEILKYSQYYNKLLNPSNEQNFVKLQKELKALNMLKAEATFPFILQVYDDFEQKKIDENTFIQVLRTVQSYIWRRYIVRLASNNNIFIDIYRKIKDKSKYVETIQTELLKKTGVKRFPDNEELRKALKSKNFFSIPSNKRIYFFHVFENFNNKENIDITQSDYTTEHICPQNIEKWRAEKELTTDEAKIIKNEYLHTISNLTITVNNSKLSDKIFKEKCIIFKDSRLKINRDIANNYEKWNVESMESRFDTIFEKFCNIWIYPDIKINENEKENLIGIFDIQYSPGLKIEYFTLFDEVINVKNNKEILIKVASELFIILPSFFTDTDGNLMKKLKVTKKPPNNKFKKIGGGHYIYIPQKTNDILNKVKLILDEIGFNDDLQIKFKDN